MTLYCGYGHGCQYVGDGGVCLFDGPCEHQVEEGETK